MFKRICVTNRTLCKGNFLEKIEELGRLGLDALILREKDLREEEYTDLAQKVREICLRHHLPFYAHSFTNSAKKLGVKKIHLPLASLREVSEKDKAYFDRIGSSCHSVEEALEAQALGCTYIFAGHIYKTSCKEGLEPRGLEFLRILCQAVKIPVYAIGGIEESKFKELQEAGAKGACIMSGFMRELK